MLERLFARTLFGRPRGSAEICLYLMYQGVMAPLVLPFQYWLLTSHIRDDQMLESFHLLAPLLGAISVVGGLCGWKMWQRRRRYRTVWTAAFALCLVCVGILATLWPNLLNVPPTVSTLVGYCIWLMSLVLCAALLVVPLWSKSVTNWFESGHRFATETSTTPGNR